MYREQAPYEGPIIDLDFPSPEDETLLLTWRNSRIYTFVNSEFNYLRYLNFEAKEAYAIAFDFLGQETVDTLCELDFPISFQPEFREIHYDWQDGLECSALFRQVKISPFAEVQPSLGIAFQDAKILLEFTWQNSYLRLFSDSQYNHAAYMHRNERLFITCNQKVLAHMSQNYYPLYYSPEVDQSTYDWLTNSLVNEMLCTPNQEIVQKILNSRSDLEQL